MRSALLLLALVGCGEAVTDVPVKSKPTKTAAATEEVKEKAEAVNEASEEALPVEEYRYNPTGKRDPFQSFIAKQQATQAIRDDAPPLQRYPVEKFSLKGVVSESGASHALLIDPEGLGHVVRVGTYVGNNWGKVTSISDGGIVVTEEFQDMEGNLIVSPVTIRFPGSNSQ
jgi:type IV pilus assembly protein PilP